MIVIDAQMFRAMIRSGAMDLQRHCEEVNNLNVFPVPDGDTGLNMFATMRGGVEAIDAATSSSLGECCNALSRGMLLSARGNSGVILSQFFAGLTEKLSQYEQANVMQFAQAFESGVKRAYEVVVKPVEGTILTVMREGGEYALGQIDSTTTFEDYFTHLLNKMRSTLMATPDLLPVLKEAGVIDSGGAGLLYIVEGMGQALGGKIIMDVSLGLSSQSEQPMSAGDLSAFNENSSLDYGYCTEFILQLTKAKDGVKRFVLSEAIAYWTSIGDSLVAFQDGTLVKVHVHTEMPDKAISYALQYGEFVRFKMENMTLQHNQTLIEKTNAVGMMAASPSLPKKAIASIAVAPTEEVASLFRDYGIDEVVNVGNLMNPGAKDFIKAFKAVNATDIFVFPNNKNEIMVVEMAASAFKDSVIHVIPTADIAQGLSCASVFDAADLGVEENLARVTNTLEHSSTVAIYRASRDATIGGTEIKKGTIVYGNASQSIRPFGSLSEAFRCWFEEHKNADSSLLSIIYGKDVAQEEKDAIASLVEDDDGFLETQSFDGGDFLYEAFAVLD